MKLKENIARIEEWDQIQKAQKNSAEFEPLYNKYFLPIYHYVYKRTENSSVAGDVTSEVFAKAIQKLGTYKNTGLPFSSWLFRVAQNCIYDLYRKRKVRRIVDVSDTHLNQIADVIESTESEDRIARILALIPGLPKAEITLLELRFFENRSYKEIGEILDLSEQNARTKLHRLIKKLRSLLSVKNKQHG